MTTHDTEEPMTQHEYQVGDVVEHNLVPCSQMTVTDVNDAERYYKIGVRLDNGTVDRYMPRALRPVRVTADHIGKWARGFTNGDDHREGPRRGRITVLTTNTIGTTNGAILRDTAVLVAGPDDDPAPQPVHAQPEEDAAKRWRISGLTDVLVRDEQGEVVLMARTPEHAARAVAAVNEANGLREEVKRLREDHANAEDRRVGWQNEADALKAQNARLRAELVEVQDVAERANGKRIQAEAEKARAERRLSDARVKTHAARESGNRAVAEIDALLVEARAERDRLAAQLAETQDTDRGLDLPDVEVHRDERGLYVDMGGSMQATLPNTESTEFSAVRAAAVLALHRARLVEERGAAQDDAPTVNDDVDWLLDAARTCEDPEAVERARRIAAAARRAGQEDKR